MSGIFLPKSYHAAELNSLRQWTDSKSVTKLERAVTLIERPSSTNAKLYDITQDSALINCLGHEHAVELCGIYNEQFKEKNYSNKISSACPSIQVINIRTPFF